MEVYGGQIGLLFIIVMLFWDVFGGLWSIDPPSFAKVMGHRTAGKMHVRCAVAK